MEKLNLKSSKEFFLKYKQIVVLMIVSTLLFCANFWNPLWIVAVSLLGIYYMFCGLGEIICFTMFFVPLSGIGLFYIVSLLCGFASTLGHYIYDLAKKQAKFYAFPFLITTLIVAIFAPIHYKIDYLGFQQGAIVIAFLYVAYFAFVYKKNLDAHKSFRFLVYGILTSVVFGLLSLPFKNFGYPLFYFDGIYNRLQLFTYYPNHLAMISTFVIAYMIYAIINKRGNLWFNVISIALCLALGVATYSKAFLLLCVLLFGYACLFLIAKFKWKSLKVILPLLLVFAAIVGIFNKTFITIFERFLAYETGSSLISKFTTGRSGIWYEYLWEITSTIPKMLFGFGLFNAEVNILGCHNVLIYFAYRTGGLGLVLLGALVYSYLQSSEHKIKFNFATCLVFLTWVVIAMEEMIFSDRFFLFLILGLLLMNDPKQEKLQK